MVGEQNKVEGSVIAAKEWCPKHNREERIYPVRGRECEEFSCGYQVYWGAGSIMEKSTTPFETWKAIYRADEADMMFSWDLSTQSNSV